MSLGKYIEKRRKSLKISSRQLALSCKITPPYMNDIEKGKRIPSFEILTRLSRELKLEEQEIYKLFDLAADYNKGKVSYDIAEYIMSNDELRQCIRCVIKNDSVTVWKSLLKEINQEGKT